uniref:Ig-like domain-containing protein n=1 Tax=Branchiostoma floridae TaxID=7739 RepID=C3YX37_BRAFL|eukprot:XP_002599043.1 hypothetical protein BRAFLDRAFT_81702 [Branchiostoma floridae]
MRRMFGIRAALVLLVVLSGVLKGHQTRTADDGHGRRYKGRSILICGGMGWETSHCSSAHAAVYRTVPQSTAVLLGHDVTLNCSLSGLSEQDVVNWHWYNRASQAKHHHISAGSVVAPEFSRYSIVGDTEGGEFNLRIQNARLEDEGKYQCSVFSVDGVSRDAKLTVIVPPPEPPRITGNSNPHRVGEGAVLTCRSEGGSPLPRLSWYNGSVQYNQSDTETSGNGVEVNYLVPRLTKWHNGANLSCRADQHFPGTVQPQVVWTVLDVQYPPTVTVSRPQITVVEGGSANLSCVVDSNPVSHITWSRLGDHMPPRLEIRGQELHIPVVSRTDSGTYQCEADSSVGQGARGLINLNVLYPSTIARTFDSEMSVLYGQDVLRLECVADGNPKPRVWWRRNDTNGLYENPLTLSPMDYRAEGLYECVADNDAFPEARRRTKIDVIGRPDVLSEPAVISVSEGEQVVLTCNISADPVSEVTWILRRPDGGEARYKVGETGHVRVTAHAGSVMCSELRIESTYASDAGDYMCKATNIFGSDQQEFRVSVKASRTMVIAISTAAAASGTLLLIMIIFCFRWWLRRRKTSATAAKTSEAFIRCPASETKKPVNNYCESPRLKASMVEVHQLNGALKQRTCSTLVDDDSPCDELFFPFPTEVRKEYVTLDRRLCGEDESLTWDSTYYIRELQKLPTNTKVRSKGVSKNKMAAMPPSRFLFPSPIPTEVRKEYVTLDRRLCGEDDSLTWDSTYYIRELQKLPTNTKEKHHGTTSRRRSNQDNNTGGQQLDRSGSRQHVDTPTIKDHHRARPDFVPRTESQRKLRTYRADIRPPHSGTAYNENLKNHHVDRGGKSTDKSPGTYSPERSQTRDIITGVDYRAPRQHPEPNRPRSSRPRRPDVHRPGHGRAYRDHYIREEDLEYDDYQDRQTQRKKQLVATFDPEKYHGTTSRRRSNHDNNTEGQQLDRSGSRQHVDTPTIKDHHRARPDFVPRTESQRKLRTYRADIRPPHSGTAYNDNLKNHHVDRGGKSTDKSPGTYSPERSQTRDIITGVDYRAPRQHPEPNRPRSSRPRRPDVHRPGHGRAYRDHYIREEDLEYDDYQDRQTQRKKQLVATFDPVGQ